MFNLINSEDFCSHLNSSNSINSKVSFKNTECYVKDIVMLTRRNSKEWLTEGLIEVFLKRYLNEKQMYLAASTISKILIDGSHDYLKVIVFSII